MNERDAAPANRLLRIPAVMGLTGVSRATIYKWIEAQRFPAPVRLGANSVAWRYADVEAWIASREPGARPKRRVLCVRLFLNGMARRRCARASFL